MIEGKYINGTDDLTEVRKLRELVFHDPDYRTDHLFDLDTGMICDEMAVHAIARMSGKVVACGTLFYDGETFLLDRVAVPEEERRKKYGDFIVRMLADRAFQGQAESITAYIDESLFPFLQIVGFRETARKDGMIRCELKKGFLCKECQTGKRS